MLESMTARQYREWLAFYQIRAERETPERAGGGYGSSKEEQQRMSGDILRAMSGYQKRRDALKHKPRGWAQKAEE